MVIFYDVYSVERVSRETRRRASESRSETHPHASSLGQGLRAPSRTFNEIQMFYFNAINRGKKQQNKSLQTHKL